MITVDHGTTNQDEVKRIQGSGAELRPQQQLMPGFCFILFSLWF